MPIYYNKHIEIDGVPYPVAIIKMQRKGDILDLTANRTEDGVLHREVIGTYYNYSLEMIAPTDPELYEKLWWKLTEPIASHRVRLPYQPTAFEGYFSSCKDEIKLVDKEGKYIGMGISCNLTMINPARRAGRI